MTASLAAPFTGVCIVATGALLVSERAGHFPSKAVFKLTAAGSFVAVAIARGATESAFGLALLVALAFSALGDALLLSERDGPLKAGILAFLVGHLGYAAAFLVHGIVETWALAGLGAAALVAIPFSRWILRRVDDSFQRVVRAYIAVISGMVALAVGAFGAGATPLVPFGAAMFFVSDITVALDRFVGWRFRHRLVGHPLYFGGQLLLAWASGG